MIASVRSSACSLPRTALTWLRTVFCHRWSRAAICWLDRPAATRSRTPVCLPLVAVLGHGLGDLVAATHLLLGCTTLRLVIATRPDLVEDRG